MGGKGWEDLGIKFMGIEKDKTLALIPARGGSKSLPTKNILPFQGKPLVVHSIEQALQAMNAGRVIIVMTRHQQNLLVP